MAYLQAPVVTHSKRGAVIVLATPYSGSQLYILILTFITGQLVLLENFLVQESVPPTLILLSLYIHLTYLEDPDSPHKLLTVYYFIYEI